MKYHFNIYKKENGSCMADGIELPDCSGKGDNIDDLWENLKKILNIYLDEEVSANKTIPLPKAELRGSKEILSVPTDIKLAFPIILKHIRMSRKLTTEQAQMLMGLQTKSSYTRLEAKCNPNLETLQRVFNAFPEFPIEQVLSIKTSPE